MEKVNEIALSGKIFAIEESANILLSQYLEDIQRHLRGDDDTISEIILEIEKKIAKRLDAVWTNPRRAITQAHVSAILAKMGPAKDVGDIHNIIERILSHHRHIETAKKEKASVSKSFMLAHQFIGFLLFAISSLALIFITLEIFNLDLKTVSSSIRLPFDAFKGDYQIPTMVMLYLLCIIPLIFLILLGISILIKKNIFNQVVAWFLITVWILLIVISALSANQIIASANLNQPLTASATQTLFVK